jgi:hypothetical protein
MGCVNKKLPADWAGSLPQRGEGGEEDELSAFVFLQKGATLAGRIHSENNNHRYKND